MQPTIYGTNKGNAEEQTDSRKECARRPRNLTCLKLQWLAERVRRCEQLRKNIANGTYEVDSRKVARALLGLEPVE